MRLFIAVFPANSFQNQIVEWTRGWAGRLAEQRIEFHWSKPENMHFTLKFLGETPDERVDALTDSLRSAVKGLMPFGITPGKVLPFPDRGEMQMLWLDLAQGQDELVRLAAQADQACAAAGFAAESRPFRPHLTLARLKSVRGSNAVRRIVDQLPAWTAGGFTVEALFVVRSILSPAGPTYTPLRTIQLSDSTQ